MKQLIDLMQKEKRLIIGLMSGTSMDGIDAALVEVRGNGVDTAIHQLDFITYPFPEGFKEFALKNSLAETSNVAEIARLNFLIAQLYADAVSSLCKHANVNVKEVDLIGSHGQTIHHLPDKIEMFGKQVGATFQIGDPSVLAKLTGVVTVGDFRVGDVALGGQGAPLVPYFDYILFRSEKATRMLLNIGGIANITYLPEKCEARDVLAFDTGPGNMVIDQLMKVLYDKEFDNVGNTALAGKVLGSVMDFLMKDEFVRRSPPKSTGREQYGKRFVSEILSMCRDSEKMDIISTVTEFTVMSVYANYLLFLKPKGDIDEMYVSGGGSHNNYILRSLRQHFSSTRVEIAESIGISADAKEAICFAVLANETISGNAANMPSVTGASRPTILGKVCFP